MSNHLVTNVSVNQVEQLPGLMRRTLGVGDQAMVCEFYAQPGVIVPTHSHAAEQIGYLISGEMRLTVHDATFTVQPGDSYTIPSDAPHSAHFVTACYLIEVFSPVRPELL